jgi:hypothetical protein
MTGMRYRVNVPAVASQVMGGEAILIHFDSGRYYSVEGSGADIVAGLEQGRTADEIVAQLSEAQTGGAGQALIADAVAKFLRELADEGLVVPADGDGDEPAARAARGPSSPFVTPRLTRYTDLEELLRLDPIHDVDAAGWPIAKVV